MVPASPDHAPATRGPLRPFTPQHEQSRSKKCMYSSCWHPCRHEQTRSVSETARAGRGASTNFTAFLLLLLVLLKPPRRRTAASFFTLFSCASRV